MEMKLQSPDGFSPTTRRVGLRCRAESRVSLSEDLFYRLSAHNLLRINNVGAIIEVGETSTEISSFPTASDRVGMETHFFQLSG
mmetsp:Transcript_14125/g.28913  ORF Transcript_14125/g.28913 Transcript_14125/m.28913 type:complete len:84 (+) Transcript_14125:1634-1885(+)